MTSPASKNNNDFQPRLAFSKDGTAISYRSIGTGTPLVVVPGALGMASDFEGFARELADQYTVHVIDRRGRGESGLQGNNYSVEKECEDIEAVCKATRAKHLFGHSYGGFIVLETVRRVDGFSKVAVYEPGMSIDGSINMDWVPECQAQLDQGMASKAFITFIHGVNPASRSAPRWLMRIILWCMMKPEELQQKQSLLHTTIVEHAELARLDNTYLQYRDIGAKVLLLVGKDVQPANPGWVATKLLPVLQDAAYTSFPKLDHLGPERSPKEVAAVVSKFFSNM
jgi:pimeloyl-ACP methyl ester carboxylesterase